MPIDSWFREELFDGRVDVHDRSHFELKLDYTIDARPRPSSYRIEAWFFIPKGLGINARTYSNRRFYDDIHAHIRFKTPRETLGGLLSGERSDSPFVRLDELIARLRASPKDGALHRKIGRELRILGCFLRAGAQDRAHELLEALKLEPASEENPNEVEAFVYDLEHYLRRFREYRALLFGTVPEWLEQVHELVDEYQSLIVETVSTALVQVLDGAAEQSPERRAARSTVRALLVSERAHRSAMDSESVLHAGARNEEFIRRRGALKKLVTSVLWLDVSDADPKGRWSELGAAIAAGTAMLFAVLVAVYSQKRWAIDTAPFLLAAVGSYVVKDRIKEWLKRFFARGMTRVLWDRSVRVFDPYLEEPIGRCREVASFVPLSEVPEAVVHRRHGRLAPHLEQTAAPESILRYEKMVRLDGRKIVISHNRLGDITDVIRFNVARFLGRADDPFSDEPVYDPEADLVSTVRAPKLYHLHVVFVLTSLAESETETTRHVRVVLDKRGIQRLDEL